MIWQYKDEFKAGNVVMQDNRYAFSYIEKKTLKSILTLLR